jgi:transcriptional regulator with XRE-family HTH domain
MVLYSAPVNKNSADNGMIGDRIKEERERLGLTQPVFAEAAGAAKRTLIEWEKGSTSPNAVQLSALYAIGVDVQYILTGIPSATTLAADERLLLERYRSSSQALKDAALRVLLNGEQDPSGAKFILHGSVGQNVQTHTMSDFKIDMRKTKKRKE